MAQSKRQFGKQTRPTLKTLSEMTGLSMSTVSLALRGGANLRAETRDRILEAARRVGYEPDRAGVRLRTGRTGTLGLILDGSEASLGFSRRLIAGIHSGIRGHDYMLNVLPQFDRADSEQTLQRIVQGRLADGVILTHTEPMDRRVQYLNEAGIPFVTHGRTEFYTGHAYHDFDIACFVRSGLARLVELGARHVAAVIVDNPTTCSHIMRQTFQAVAAELGIRAEVIVDQMPDDGPGVGHVAGLRDLGRQLAMRPDRPDGILSDNELATLALTTGLRDSGIVPGRDIHIISKQTSDLLRTLYPEVDTLEERVEESGRELARLLLARIGGKPAEELQTLARPVPHFG
ncbi:MAG: substrate-binding domain-containing protein [Rubellimicrobium sp.]|nr:substrate-binding domain-containing protein [Rubellimicrobium sp.]